MKLEGINSNSLLSLGFIMNQFFFSCSHCCPYHLTHILSVALKFRLSFLSGVD